MNNTPTVAYIHSKICDAIITEADISGQLPIVGCIYGRGYRGFTDKSRIYFFDESVSADVQVIAYAYLIARFFSSINADGIRLVIPHDGNGNLLFRLLASHRKVTEVLYIEEGQLSYEEQGFFNNSKDYNRESLVSQPVSELITALGFNVDEINRVWNAKCWFSDLHGKYRGVIASSVQAFKGLPGSRIIVTLPQFDLGGSVCLVSVTHFEQASAHVNKLLGAYGMTLENTSVYSALFRAFKKQIEVAVNDLRRTCANIIIKSHPSMEKKIFDSMVSGVIGDGCTSWDNTTLEYDTRSVELGHISFVKFAFIGESSTIMYASDRVADRSNIILYSNHQIAVSAIGILLNEMEQAHKTHPHLTSGS